MRKIWKTLCVAACAMQVFASPAYAFKVVVDPGHGGSDSGAIGVGGLQEKDVNLDIAKRLQAELEKLHYDVYMTRTTDVFLSLAERVEVTNKQHPDIFVSVHANSINKSSIKGTMVLYYDADYPQSDYPASAEMIGWSAISKSLAQDTLNAFVDKVGTVNLGLTESAVYVVRMGTVPSILVETAFVSNPSDAALLSDPAQRQKMAEGIAAGIAKFQSLPFPDINGHWAKDAIMRLKDKGIVNGVNHYFLPNKALTRAEYATILDRAFGFPEKEEPAACVPAKASNETPRGIGLPSSATVTGSVYGSNGSGQNCQQPAAPVPTSFRDLPAYHWANATLMKAAKLRYIEGYEDGTIRPDQPITRAEAAVLLDRIIGNKLPAASSSGFTDVPTGNWAASAVARLHAAGIIGGVTDTEYAPARSITRGEISVMLNRYLK